MNLLKKWDFWYWILLILISVGSFYFYSKGDGGSGDAALVMLTSIIFIQFVGVYVIAKLGQFLVRFVTARNKKHN